MKSAPLVRPPLALPLAMVTLALAAGPLTGCRTNEIERNEAADSISNSSGKPLQFPTPVKGDQVKAAERWTTLPRQGGKDFILPKDGLADVVRLSAFGLPTEPSVRTLDDVEKTLKSDPALGFETLERKEIYGVPVIRFTKAGEDPAASGAQLARQLGQPERPGGTYFVRTEGAFFLHSGPSGTQLVTIALSRTSSHGEIGTHFEQVFEDYLAVFVADCML